MSSINGRIEGPGSSTTSFKQEHSAGEGSQQKTEALLAKVEAQLEDMLKLMSHAGAGPSTQADHSGHHGHQGHESRGAERSHNASDASDARDKHATDKRTATADDSDGQRASGGSRAKGTTQGQSTSGSAKTSSGAAAAAGIASANSASAATPGDHSRETLAAGHGWGAQNGGVTGGSKADKAHVYTVSTRDQLIAALGGNNATNGSNSTPKIIQIEGNINLNADSNGKDMSKGDFANEKAQLAHDMINVGSNTTIIGIGNNAGISGGGFNASNQRNIIIRNLNMTSPFDFFPGKDAEGNPHGRVYSIEAKGTQNLWVDHNTFKDGTTPAGAISGDQLDFTDGANYATVSNNQFLSHNKSILIGSSDSMTSDKGKLNVTIDHNLFAGVSQRDPRVRFGNVEVANNLYQDSSSQANRFQYNLGVGVDSNVTSQNNAFETNGVSTQSLVKRFGDSGHLTDSGSLVNGQSVNLSSSPTGNGPGAGGIAHLDATDQVAAIVLAQSGAGKIGLGD